MGLGCYTGQRLLGGGGGVGLDGRHGISVSGDSGEKPDVVGGR